MLLKVGRRAAARGYSTPPARATLAGTLLIVAVHDVAPSTLGEVRWLLARLDDAGVERRVLLTVPAETGAGDADRSELEGLVRREAAAGSEMVLHGWTHRAAGPYRGSFGDRVRARLLAHRSAEFLALDAAEIAERLAAGRRWLAEAGVTPGGFCAPAWLWTPALAPAAREAGFRYLVGLRGLQRLDGRPPIGLPPIGYLGAGPVQELAWRLGELALWRPMAALGRTRIRHFVVHPQHASSSRDCARVLREVGRAARNGGAATYGELLDA